MQENLSFFQSYQKLATKLDTYIVRANKRFAPFPAQNQQDGPKNHHHESDFSITRDKQRSNQDLTPNESHLRYLHPPEVISISAEIEINTAPNRYHFRPKSHRQVNTPAVLSQRLENLSTQGFRLPIGTTYTPSWRI